MPPMASPLVSRAPQCLSCIRRISYSLGDTFQLSPGYQIRGKKKVAKPKVKTVNAYLLQDVAGYGPPGSMVPVTAGTMRNEWYPKKMAEYLTTAKIEELGLKRNVAVERDYTFKSTAHREMEKQKAREQKEREALEAIRREQEENVETRTAEGMQAELEPNLGVQMLKPTQAIVVLERLLPVSLDFFRTPISASQTPVSSKKTPQGSDILEVKQPEKTSIYGSVTTSDIATNLKAILAEDSEGARVVLSAGDISFVEETADRDRVKHLGEYEFDIKLEGATESIRRTIKINAQD